MVERIVIVGAGHAGTQAAVSLRQAGFRGRIRLFGAEPALPYQRPPLSKKYLLGEVSEARIALRAPGWYADRGVALERGRRIVEIDLDRQLLTPDRGERVAWDRLLLATGSRLRRLEVPGGALAGVHYLRTLADADRLGAALREARRVVVVGGGYIGLEVAAAARGRAVAEVTVVERAPRLLPRVASAEFGRAVGRLHERRGVRVLVNAAVTAVRGAHGRVEGVVLADGRDVPADVVVIGVGVEAETALAQEAGLRVDDGIVVDEFCQTSHPLVYAAGDCTSHPNRFLRRRVRLESVPNATAQARTAAAAMLGTLVPYADAPWFWSEQYGAKLQIAGLLEGHEETLLRGDPATDSFALFHLRDGRLACVETLDRVPEFMAGRRLIEAQVNVDDDALADDTRPFNAIAERLLGPAA